MRNPKTDRYMELLFGKPDFSKSFIKNGQVWTPMGNRVKLWGVDSLASAAVKREDA